ncbi:MULTISPECIES: bifunctional enoyl-CoA hydratase/phosphate acetyltransferase [unclassified Sedimentibacter]|uniref:bifunctional enoyl-CoA hydratase/phosphate acetyltransferase n=1 Tax=unclassified Sedimentibacter TaxID=2649220 RepID=UPI0027E0BD4D|nr:bifunctional enoyl-CoA hydratase/phosphate acetyltransferase [Sedimentibacter sp. MB35-C1]WMJ78537.1 bifunctional enoyl-CoA hydratase/phosphate acetyltransferase [Sedimentibacter sp. MB35-C1]
MYVKNFAHLMELSREKKSKKIAVVAADDNEVLEVVAKAEENGLAEFILIGDKAKIEKLISSSDLKLKSEIIDESDHKKAADLAVDLVVKGKAGSLMKGMLHSSVFLKAILNKEKGLNTGRHITQISILEKKNKDGLMFITDCAITVNPDLLGKKEVLENAVDLAHKLGNEKPKVAVLASLEVVNPGMQDTIDAAVLSKMAERGQIKGCVVDGPFAFDNAVSLEAAKAKGISGPVAGNADIIVVPNLTVGNALTKSITYVARKTVVAATVGAAVPIVFTSRTESTEGKLLSIALASYIS